MTYCYNLLGTPGVYLRGIARHVMNAIQGDFALAPTLGSDPHHRSAVEQTGSTLALVGSTRLLGLALGGFSWLGFSRLCYWG